MELAIQDEHDAAAVDEAIEAVKRSLRQLKTAPSVDSFATELITDSNGFGAASITVVLKDDPSGEPYSWEQVRPIHDLIWQEFNERTLDRWPYIQFHLKSEHENQTDDDWVDSE